MTCKEEVKIGEEYYAQGGAKQWHTQCVNKSEITIVK